MEHNIFRYRGVSIIMFKIADIRLGGMLLVKNYLETVATISIYVAVAIYIIIQKVNGALVYPDAQLFVGLTIVFFLLGFISFFNIKRYVRIAGLSLMLITILMTALFLFL
jgi:hypothetical protein